MKTTSKMHNFGIVMVWKVTNFTQTTLTRTSANTDSTLDRLFPWNINADSYKSAVVEFTESENGYLLLWTQTCFLMNVKQADKLMCIEDDNLY